MKTTNQKFFLILIFGKKSQIDEFMFALMLRKFYY